MTIDYDREAHIKDLEPIMDEYTSWFMHVVRRLFFAVDTPDAKPFRKPELFGEWLKLAEEKSVIETEIINGLAHLYHDLWKGAETLLTETQKLQRSPGFKEFDQLTTFFEEFINSIRRISRDYQSGEGGIDPQTGLRNRDMFFKDIRREMDRLSRQGKPFCIALVRIDDHQRFHDNINPEDLDACLKLIAQQIRKSMRSFDDGYRMEDNVFVLTLKQTGVSGGMKALYRLKAELDKQNICYSLRDGDFKLSLSSCIAEPLPEDDIRQLLQNMDKDLEKYIGQKSVVLEYFEMSPLQRFIKEGQE